MPRMILRFETDQGPRYLEYSTIVDAAVTWGMPLDEFQEYYKERYGTEGMKELPERLARADKHGSSFYWYGTDLLQRSGMTPRVSLVGLDAGVKRYRPRGTFDPAERAREKRASRDADAQALADGTKTREQLRRENAVFAFPRDRVRLTPPKRER